MKRQEAPLEIRRTAPTTRLTRLKIDVATCAACGRSIRRGDLVKIDRGRLVHPKGVPCVPAWEA